MISIQSRIYLLIKKMVNILGFNIVLSRRQVNSITDFINQVKLHQKNIENLKVVLNRKNLLEKIPENGIVAELGVDKGNFSAEIISLTRPKKLYLIDSWDSVGYNSTKMNYVNKKFQKEMDAGRVIIIRGKSEEELLNFEDGFFDWVYIDTTHSYKQTVEELELCRKKVKDGGIIAGHDYCQGNINDALAYGVVQAVNQFCIANDWEFIYLTHETDRILSFAIKKIR